MDGIVYAHTPPKSGGDWHPLTQHLIDTAEKARSFADAFGGGDLAYWVGLWHDLGKCNPKFQDYLWAEFRHRRSTKQPHAIWGAALAYHLLKRRSRQSEIWKDVALPIAAHHTRLDDWGTLAQHIEQFVATHPEALARLYEQAKAIPTFPHYQPPYASSGALRRELFIRMVFSALLDADRLDTERHFNPDKTTVRDRWPTLAELRDTLDAKMAAMNVRAESDPTAVNRVRREVYESCKAAAPGTPGVYRLMVPTGGGKTLSALTFALHHALAQPPEHQLRRVIVAIPYTSIIEQTAKVYNEFLGPESFIEHHSQAEAPDEEDMAPDSVARQLAIENWDAPVILTTTVQLFESLLGNRTNQVRKLHNISRSVIVLDEVQTLPPHLLEPTLDVLRTLAEVYRVTIVLSTATQPALEDTWYIKAFHGMSVTPIVREHAEHFNRLRRVRYSREPKPVHWEQLSEKVRTSPQIMVVLNTRRDALTLLDRLRGTEGLEHLSTLLCGAHRRVVLDRVKAALDLNDPRPMRLITTQVVEAGVDIDFPVVWRAMGPLDRIVQAAGRCNREGKRSSIGEVVIFQPVGGGMPLGAYKKGFLEAQNLLEGQDPEVLHDPELYREYFRRLCGIIPPDEKRIQELRSELRYPAVAKEYRLIEEDTVPVVVPYLDGMDRLDAWLAKPTRTTWQKLQPYLVSVRRRDVPELMRQGLASVTDGLYRWDGDYDKRTGMSTVRWDPTDLCV